MPYPTKKLGENIEDKSKDSRILFSILTGRNSHILTIVIVGHLLTEHLLDKIITAKFKNKRSNPKESFSQKLELLYPMWLPLFIYKNIKLLNESRNDIAHNLGSIDYKPFIYTHRGEKKIVKIPKRKNEEKFYFRELINTVLFDLVNYSSDTLGISNDIDLNIIFRQKN
ncbi:MAG: hypothetical protein HYT98_02630 [Candidatus Sungbacteria bacterium]|nr:hypothetical protein [Candidatus Sungbacteria bacterium]